MRLKFSEKYTLAGLLLLALAIRLWGLGQSDLWQDEVGFLNIATTDKSVWQVFLDYWFYSAHWGQLPLAGVVQSIYHHAVHPWNGNVMQDFFWVRIPSVLFGIVAVLSIFRLAVLLGGKETGWSAAFIMTFFFYPVYYSRELYCYSAVICFSTLALYYYARIAWRNDAGRGAFIGLFVSLSGLVLSHYAGSMLAIVMGGVAGGRWVLSCLSCKKLTIKNPFFRAGLGCMLAFLTVLPYWIHLFTSDNVLSAWSCPLSIFAIWNDVVSKLFFGERPMLAGLAWLLFLSGAVAFLWRKERLAERVDFLLILFATVGLLTLAVKQSQYLSARYFAPIISFAYILLAEALWFPLRLMHKPDGKAKILCLCMTVAVCCLHLFYFFPSYYRLTAKSVDFGRIARWLNNNLPAGTPYLIASAYELRWVGGYYRTPGLIPVSPYVHGGGPEEEAKLRALQEDFMARFPESAHVISDEGGDEDRLRLGRKYYRHEIYLPDENLRQLVKTGIYPTYGYKLKDLSLVATVFYNTPQDARDLARASGRPVYFSFPEWEVVGIPVSPMQKLYMRMAVPMKPMVLENLTGTSFVGVAHLTLCIPPTANKQSVSATLGVWDGANRIGRFVLNSGEIREHITMPLRIPQQGTRINFSWESSERFPAVYNLPLLLYSARIEKQ